jgi:hypothetical protein
MLAAPEHVGLHENTLFLRTACDADALGRWRDCGAGFEQNHPVLIANIVWMNGNEMV